MTWPPTEQKNYTQCLDHEYELTQICSCTVHMSRACFCFVYILDLYFDHQKLILRKMTQPFLKVQLGKQIILVDIETLLVVNKTYVFSLFSGDIYVKRGGEILVLL